MNAPYKIGRLFFRYVMGTPLENQGWTATRIAEVLEAKGLIKIVETQGHDAKGQWVPRVKGYIELKRLNSEVVVKALK